MVVIVDVVINICIVSIFIFLCNYILIIKYKIHYSCLISLGGRHNHGKMFKAVPYSEENKYIFASRSPSFSSNNDKVVETRDVPQDDLPDGWERKVDKRGRIFYTGKLDFFYCYLIYFY
jgi:hypothetical protein